MPFANTFSNESIANTPDSGSTSDNWFSSPASSQDCSSSISSIPWAEDAIKQNKDEWERIERIFYGEAPLPADKKIADEFIEWMTKFPHLRVTGHRIPIHLDYDSIGSDQNYEEIIAIDPPIKPTEKIFIDSARFRDRHANCNDRKLIQSVPDDLELEMGKCLRITSGPPLSRTSGNGFVRHYKINGSVGNSKKPSIIPLIKEENYVRVASVKSDMYNRARDPVSMPHSSKTHHELFHRRSQNPKRFSRIPTMLNLQSNPNRPNASELGSNSSRPTKHQISLPAITLVAQSRQPKFLIRSISAVGKTKPIIADNLPKKITKPKHF